MAGRLGTCRYCRRLLVLMTAALVVTVLVTTNRWNPLPQLATWWDKLTELSDPAPTWQVRLGGVPDVAAVMATGSVVLASRGFVEGYDRFNGRQLWHHDAHWALPAGDVVVMRPRASDPDANRAPDTGYSVVEPVTGAVLWGDRDAIAVWAYSDRIIDLVCPASGDCRLRGRLHSAAGRQLWAVALPANARTIIGADPALAAVRDPADSFADAARGTPGPMPAVIGIPLDGRVHIVDTVDGTKVRDVAAPDRQTRVVVAGERLLYVRAVPADSGCRFHVEAVDRRAGTSLWAADGLDLDTASGAGCEQRKDPLGAGNRLIGVRPDNHPALLSVADGRAIWLGVPGERVLDTDGELAVVQGADQESVRVVDLLDPRRTEVWSGRFGPHAQAAVTHDHVIVTDGSRITVLSHVGPTPVAELKTRGTVAGYGPRGLVIASGRRIGFIALSA